jgi:hypothetical protein
MAHLATREQGLEIEVLQDLTYDVVRPIALHLMPQPLKLLLQTEFNLAPHFFVFSFVFSKIIQFH